MCGLLVLPTPPAYDTKTCYVSHTSFTASCHKPPRWRISESQLYPCLAAFTFLSVWKIKREYFVTHIDALFGVIGMPHQSVHNQSPVTKKIFKNTFNLALHKKSLLIVVLWKKTQQGWMMRQPVGAVSASSRAVSLSLTGKSCNRRSRGLLSDEPWLHG